MKRKYDVVFSLGGMCGCTQSLRLANLQFASFPWDWLFGGSPSARARGLLDNFESWFIRSDLVKYVLPWDTDHEPWKNTRTGIVFKHDFDWHRPIDVQLPNIREKYARRGARLTSLIEKAKRVLCVYIALPNEPDIPESEFREAYRILSSRFPNSGVELLVLRRKSGVSFENREDRTEDGIRYLTWDYFIGRDWFIDNDAMGRFFASELEVEDYRTKEERRDRARRRRLSKYQEYNAKNWLGYVVNRAQYRLYRHFRDILERKHLLRQLDR